MKIFLSCIALLAGIFALVLTLALFKRIYIFISYDKKTKVILKLFGFKITLFPRRPKPKKKSYTPEKTIPGKHLPHDKDKFSFSPLFAKKALGILGDTLKKIRVEDIRLNTSVGTSDPFLTALAYGSICALYGMITPFIDSKIIIKSKSINIRPDFEEQKTSMTFYMAISLRPISVIAAACKIYSLYSEYK